MNKLYYVYGLKNPITKSYFYIGKGKGNRYKDHLSNNNSDKNFLKKKKINEIKDKGLKVEVIIIKSMLSEIEAFELEKKLVYILGRKIFGEGILTNITPGGKWSPGEPLFNSFEILEETLKINDINSVLKFECIRNNNYLNTINSEQYIYKYNESGNFIDKQNLNDFFKIGVFERDLKIFDTLRKTEHPIYTNQIIYSKYYFKKIILSKYKIYKDFEIINQEESVEFDKEYLNKNNTQERNQTNLDWEFYIKNFIEDK